MRCLVLGARRYDFKDDDGSRVEGAKVFYLTLDASEDGETDLDRVGEVPFEVSAPFDLFSQLSEAPAFYDVDFRQRPGSRGRPTLQIVGVSYQGPVSFGVPSALSIEG